MSRHGDLARANERLFNLLNHDDPELMASVVANMRESWDCDPEMLDEFDLHNAEREAVRRALYGY